MAETRRARVRAFAKINLSLQVLGKRADGFHDLRTVFQTVSLADGITIEFTPGPRSVVEIECAVEIADNLMVRAARLALRAMRVTGRVRMGLEKRIPMGGGLGGGSSDAAAVLLALPVLAGKAIEAEKLDALALELGSDVPFFLLGGTAAGLGRGGELYPMESVRAHHGLLVVPPVHVSTAEAYGGLGRPSTEALTERVSFHRMKRFQSLVRAMAFCVCADDWKAFCENDFEAVVFRRYPLLKSLRQKLCRLGAVPARMSGSGSALFAVFESRAKREEASQVLKQAYPGVRVEPVGFLSREQYRAAWFRSLAAWIEEKRWPPRGLYKE